MRGRLYDPHATRFPTPDPLPFMVVQGAGPAPDQSPDLASAGPWPHGKASSSGLERFSSGASDGRYIPPDASNVRLEGRRWRGHDDCDLAHT